MVGQVYLCYRIVRVQQMDVLPATLWVPCTALRHYHAHVRPVLAGSINPSAVAAPFQAKG